MCSRVAVLHAPLATIQTTTITRCPYIVCNCESAVNRLPSLTKETNNQSRHGPLGLNFLKWTVLCCIVAQPSPNYQMCVIPLLITGWRIFLNIHKGQNKQGISRLIQSPEDSELHRLLSTPPKYPKMRLLLLCEFDTLVWAAEEDTHMMSVWQHRINSNVQLCMLVSCTDEWVPVDAELAGRLEPTGVGALLDVHIYVQPDIKCAFY